MTARGFRNKNPGNIDFNAAQFARDPWVGELGMENHPHARFTTFDSHEHGIRALCKLLLTYHRKRLAADGSEIDTVAEFLDRYAPPGENDTDSYANHVRKLLGVEKGEEIDPDDPDILRVLCTSIIRHENGEMPYDEDMIDAGIALALA